MKSKKGVLLGLILGMVLMGVVYQVNFFLKNKTKTIIETKKEIIDEESVVTKVVEKSANSVVTVSIDKNIVDALSLNQQNIQKDVADKLGKIKGDNEKMDQVNKFVDVLQDPAKTNQLVEIKKIINK
jgi:alkyl sulfatase BDS1-like metallo-beta-lactamase superfamily hydrolase